MNPFSNSYYRNRNSNSKNRTWNWRKGLSAEAAYNRNQLTSDQKELSILFTKLLPDIESFLCCISAKARADKRSRVNAVVRRIRKIEPGTGGKDFEPGIIFILAIVIPIRSPAIINGLENDE